MPLVQMMRAVVILKMSTMPFSIAQDIHMPESFFRTFSRVTSHLSASFSTSHNATGWPISILDQHDAHEQSLGQSDGSLPGPKQTLNQPSNHSIIKAMIQCSSIGLLPMETSASFLLAFARVALASMSSSCDCKPICLFGWSVSILVYEAGQTLPEALSWKGL